VNPSQLSSTAEILTGLVVGSPTQAVEAIADALERNDLTLESSSVGISSLPGVDTQTARRCADAFTGLSGRVDKSAVSLALRAALGLRDVERLQRPEIEIVWSGPEADGPLVRPTAVVIEEMLRGVREAGEILLVGYSLTAEDGSPMSAIIDLLGLASRRRAVVTVILHRDEEARNRANLLAAWDVRAVKPRLFTWSPPPEFPYTKLHAKTLVVDRLEALVTSANLTLHGLQANLELGLRVRGPQAQAIALRFDHLIASGVLSDWSSQ
jgi:phosphatidylserine/phosphatidylglycerophosphate/cardiolipin synthase-like enzyme